ncbi:pancreatic triacylglycerol lipase-like isoform X2 [Prorops nasuta]
MKNTSSCCITILLLLAVASGVMGQQNLTDDNLSSIFFRFYNGALDNYQDEFIDNTDLLMDLVDNSKPTVLYVHGYTESVESTSVKTVVGAYLKRKDHNTIAVDYSKFAGEDYLSVAKGAGDVGTVIAGGLDRLVSAGLDPEKIQVVGHSMGAQVSSRMSKHLSFQVARITGLDPAGPSFNVIQDRLSAGDARFVDIIHTDFGGYGVARPTGNIDFFPNGGHRIQPGCTLISEPLSSDDFCSHHRSWWLYAESLLNEIAFIGVNCSSELLYFLNACSSNEKVIMGIATPPSASGKYYFRTNAQSPYGRGVDGVNP